jgi:hypothetical protein
MIVMLHEGDAANGIGFAPHEAGRKASRTAYFRTLDQRSGAEIIEEQAPGIVTRAL